MAWIIGTVLLVVAGLFLLIYGLIIRAARGKETIRDEEARGVGGIMALVGLVLFVLAMAFTGGASFQVVEAGNIGVVYEFGSIVGQIKEGPNWIAPWRSVRTANIQVQRHVFDKLDAFSAETQDVFVKATLNLKVSPDTIQELYRTVGPSWFDVLVVSRVAQNFKDETVKYKSVDIAPNREKIRQTVRERLEKELSPYSVEVVDLLLDNIDFKPEFKSAIENKQIAAQNALEENERVTVARHKAEQAVETAKGTGGSLLEIASKQADANNKLSASLTPALIQYSLIQKLGDKIQVIIMPSGQSFILDADVLKGGPPK